jgi:predicted house-cleaning noncanonical NTP pyrophosphatase (MazG superfamily)
VPHAEQQAQKSFLRHVIAAELEVVYALAAVEGVSQAQLEEMRQRKLRERGGFSQRILLVETSREEVAP